MATKMDDWTTDASSLELKKSDFFLGQFNSQLIALMNEWFVLLHKNAVCALALTNFLVAHNCAHVCAVVDSFEFINMIIYNNEWAIWRARLKFLEIFCNSRYKVFLTYI